MEIFGRKQCGVWPRKGFGVKDPRTTEAGRAPTQATYDPAPPLITSSA